MKLAGICIGIVLALVVSVAAQSMSYWTGLDRSGKSAYIMGIADGIIFMHNQAVQGRDITRAGPAISRCPFDERDLDRIIQRADQAQNVNLLVATIIAELARCGGP